MPDRRTGYYVAGRDWPAMGSGIPLEDLYRGLEGITDAAPPSVLTQAAEAIHALRCRHGNCSDEGCHQVSDSERLWAEAALRAAGREGSTGE